MHLQFKSNSTTMWTTTVMATALLALVSGACHHYEENYYAELGCKPKDVGKDGCVESYDCSTLSTRNPAKCHFKGKEYGDGQPLQEDGGCVTACRCQPQYPDNKKMAFTCANVECPVVFNGPPAPGCYEVYEHGKCCSIDEVCFSDQPAEQKTAKPTCQYKDQEYQVGMKFYPDEDQCLMCICQQGFNGSLVEPYCKKISCSMELHSGIDIAGGCIPVYYGDQSCCPIGWRCPEKSDKAVSAASKTSSPKTPNPDLQCQFGEVKMQVGDKLSVSQEWRDADCECRVPPHPVCIQKNLDLGAV